MNLEGPAKKLSAYIGENDSYDGKPLYTALVEAARTAGCAGSTVLRGIEGFGAHSRLHTAKILRLSEDLPVVVEIVDSEEKINSFLPALEKMMGGGLVTMEKVKVLHYRAGEAKP